MSFIPGSTYRIQFSKDFTFAHFVKTIPYLHELGINTIYASPFFAAIPGSEHGYDVTDPLKINPEIGTFEEFKEIIKKLKSLDMGWIQDIVPNHMAFSEHNPWIEDLLENGRQSKFGDFFDIDWDHPDQRIKGKLMLPFFDKSADKLIANREISVTWNNKRFVLKYFNSQFPLNYASYFLILGKINKGIVPEELLKILQMFEKGVDNSSIGQKGKAVLIHLYNSRNNIRDYVNENLRSVNNSPKLLHELIQLQHYAPFYWKECEKMLNYRRFFTINGMICLNMEKKHVFDAYHKFIGKICRDGLIGGLRVDHIDGLYDPKEYLDRLRDLVGNDKYIIVEKILQKGERLEKTWPIQGETGYQFLALVNNLITNRSNRALMEKTYHHWGDNDTGSYEDVIYRGKKFILYNRMAGDLDNLYRYLIKLDLFGHGIYQPEKIKMAIGEFLLHCPLYKIYNGPDTFTKVQKNTVNEIFEHILEKSPELTEELLLLETIFLNHRDVYKDKPGKPDAFFKRCMQFTGPLLAKGGEDTAFYVYNRFIGHNEVGDSPSYFGISNKGFHKEMIRRFNYFPFSLNTTSTHDTKRGEDARARLNVLSDLPHLWIEHINKWRIINRPFKKINGGNEIPTVNDEYFIYQTIISSISSGSPKQREDTFEDRLVEHVTKALREGKINTSWSDPVKEYEIGTRQFIRSILSPDSLFIKNIGPFLKKTSLMGIVNSLTQTLVKMTAPGVPDIYRGSEGLNYNFVDPDNRRPVNFRQLANELKRLKKTPPEIKELFLPEGYQNWKMFFTHLLLEQRNINPTVFEKGEYIPLPVKGRLKNKVLAFARHYTEKIYISVLPLNLGTLFDNDSEVDLEKIEWADTHILFPEIWTGKCNNLLDGRSFNLEKSLYLSELFLKIPFGFMTANLELPERRAGILMHVTSLPGDYGIGDIGQEAFRFADFLKRNGQGYWQILPLNQVYKEGGYSPYSALSVFAGNNMVISPGWLTKYKLLETIPESMRLKSLTKVQYAEAEQIKEELIDAAFDRFKRGTFRNFKKEFARFCEKEEYWLDDYSIFITLKKIYHNSKWNAWPAEYRDRDKKALSELSIEKADKIERQKFAQFIFMQQWKSLKTYCNNLGIKIFGDIPLYVNYDSADVWSHPDFFKLKKNKEIEAVAGVPPDYFSKNGQLWGMPVFNWDIMEKDGFSWWINRFKRNLDLYDLLRLDHFRGFSAHYEVPAGETTAINGRWVNAPGDALFMALKKEFINMPFVAEDLGEIDQPVYDLRDKYCLPGMKVMQFAFDDDSGKSIHALHNHTWNSIVYTGTHDNNTTKGWFKTETKPLQQRIMKKYTGKEINKGNCHLELTRLAYSSVAKLVIIPIQDIIGLGSKARMNTPSVPAGNWTWRLSRSGISTKTEKRIRDLAKTFGRI